MKANLPAPSVPSCYRACQAHPALSTELSVQMLLFPCSSSLCDPDILAILILLSSFSLFPFGFLVSVSPPRSSNTAQLNVLVASTRIPADASVSANSYALSCIYNKLSSPPEVVTSFCFTPLFHSFGAKTSRSAQVSSFPRDQASLQAADLTLHRYVCTNPLFLWLLPSVKFDPRFLTPSSQLLTLSMCSNNS